VATKSQTHETFARVTGGSAATYAKMDRILAAAGYGLPGGRGGGKNTVHVNAAYLRNMLLGSASYLPSDVVSVIDHAITCDYLGSNLSIEGRAVTEEDSDLPLGDVDVPELGKGSTAGHYIFDQIVLRADEPADEPQTMLGRPVDIEGSLIRVDFDPFAVRVEWLATCSSLCAT
jgi:hypothetical protein